MQGPLCHRTGQNTLHYESHRRVKAKAVGVEGRVVGEGRGGEATEVAAAK